MEHVLLVDDDPIQVATREAVLSRAGFNVSIATSATTALGHLRSAPAAGTIHAVVTDHIMPGVSGAVFVRQLREAVPAIPVLVVTGLPGAEAEYAGMNVSFRNKPLPPPELIAAVHALFGRT